MMYEPNMEPKHPARGEIARASGQPEFAEIVIVSH
jgi:hypothetical protein